MKFAGTKGYVGASTAIAGINSWSMDYTVDMLETTDFSVSGTSAFIPGKTQWSGTFSGFKDGTPKALGTSAAVDLWLVESASAAIASSEAKVWKGSGYINQITANTNFDGIVSYNYSFQGTAGLTAPTS